MPKITGLDFFKTLQHPPPVVFTTAYPQYALEGFEVNALDYLVKPIAFGRFLSAALKAKEYYEVRETNKLISAWNKAREAAELEDAGKVSPEWQDTVRRFHRTRTISYTPAKKRTRKK